MIHRDISSPCPLLEDDVSFLDREYLHQNTFVIFKFSFPIEYMALTTVEVEYVRRIET